MEVGKNMDYSKSNRNVMLNLLKGFACIGVVLIHITFPGKVGDLIKYASAYAVPIFFLIAGYFAFGKNVDTIKRRLIKIIKIFIFAYLIFFLFNVLVQLKNHNLDVWLRDNYKITSLAKYVIFCTIGFAIPLWYLIAQIETYIFWIITLKFKKENIVIKLIPVIFVLQVLLTAFCETMEYEWFWKINFVTRSLSWFALGYYIHSLPKEKIDRISNKKIIGTAIVGLVIAVLPIIIDSKLKFSVVGYIPYATSIFLLAIKNGEKSLCKPLEYIGDKLSLWIYIFHVPTSSVVHMFVHKLLGIDTEIGLYPWIHPVITVCAVIVIAYVFNFMLEKLKKRQ